MRIALVAASAFSLAILPGCATPTEAPAPSTKPAPTGGAALAGAEWTVFEIGGVATTPGSKVTMQFEDGRVFGAASCNRFMGGYTVAEDGLSIQMSQMASTMMACPDPLMQQEGAFLAVLGAVKSYTVGADGTLMLKTADGQTIKARR